MLRGNEKFPTKKKNLILQINIDFFAVQQHVDYNQISIPWMLLP